MPLCALFSALKERRFLFVEPGGNWGDHLIYLGAKHLAQSVNVFAVRTLTWERFLEQGARPDEVLYLHGSGGFVDTSSQRASWILQRAIETPGATVIQGPCTVADASSLRVSWAARRSDRVVFFSRERTTAALMDHLLLPSSVERCLAHDTALHLTAEAIRARIGDVEPRIELAAIREDPEAAPRQRSTTGHVVIDPARYAQSFDHWLRIHAASQSILTDRTHSAVLGSILGIPTTMFGGRYHKNRSLWEYSLRDRGVIWTEHPCVPQADLQPLRRSWKLNRFLNHWRGIPAQ